MIEILDFPFMQRALIACVLTGLLTGFLSVFVVQRRMSFLGSGLAHSSFGGVALGLWLGLEPLWVATVFTLIVAVIILAVQRKTKLETDTSIGIFFSAAMASGILFLSFRKDPAQDAMTYLFGSILAVEPLDLYLTSGLVVGLLLLLPLWKRWAYATFDRQLAEIDRLRTGRDDVVLTLLLALTIVVSIKVLGIVLLSAVLVIPAAIARMVSKRFSEMTWKSVSLGVGTNLGGLMLSYALDLPSGASIILLQVGIFLAVLFLTSLSSSRSTNF